MTFQNSDCSYTATFEEYMHYKVAPGQWERVDLGFEERGRDWVADHHDIAVTVAGASITAIDRESRHGIRWITPGEPKVSGRRATFSHEGLDWSYITTKPGLKLVATVDSPKGPRTYSFQYALVGGARDFTVDSQGNLVSEGFVVPRAVAVGADGSTHPAGAWRLLPGNRVAFDFDDSALGADAYPYELDPSTSFNVASSAGSGGTYSGGGAYPPSCTGSYTTPHWSTAQIGVERSRDSAANPNHWISNGLVRWDTSALPDTATLNSASLELGSTGQVGNHNVRNLTADWYTSSQISCADFSVTEQTTAIAGFPLKVIEQDFVPDGYATIPLSSTSGIARSGNTGLRFHISGGQLTSYEQNFYGFEGYGSAYRSAPRLVVVYDNASPNISSASDSPDPAAPGSTVTFSVGWWDQNGEAAKAVICKTNAVSSGGTCPGGSWAIGPFQSTGPSTAAYTTSSSDFGTKTYYAFACDTLGACSPSISGTFTVNNAPTISSVSDSPDPLGAGSPVTFSVGWADQNAGDTVKAVICKTNSVSSGSCPGGAWAVGAPKTSGPATATYTTSPSEHGTKTYYAFACDSLGACSPSISGTFTVNNTPTISSVSDSPDPVGAGSPVTFTVGWTDVNPGDTVKAVVCKTNSIASATCPGGTWATGNLSSTSPSTASYTTTSANAGTNTYHAFACDRSNACSGAMSGTFQVTNGAPVVTFNVNPLSGDRSTKFTGSFAGTYDPNGDPVSYRIDWGDGTVSNASYASHFYAVAGTYTVTGTVTDSSGASSSQSKTVTVAFSNRPPTATISVSPKTGDTSTNFYARVGGSDPEGDGLTYSIDWGDGTETSAGSGTHKYAEPGKYVVTGVVSDAHGAADRAFEEVEVCTALVNGTCVQPPADPCGDHGVLCRDDPTHFELPEQARALVQDQEVPLTFSANGTVLALSSNVMQAYADDGGSCAVANPKKDCNQAEREVAFAQRVLELSVKEDTTEDGMGAVPDLLLLQEVRPMDVDNIIAALEDRGLAFALGSGTQRNHDGDGNPRNDHEVSDKNAQINKMCNDKFPPASEPKRNAMCKSLSYMHADTAILYNTQTMVVNDSDHFDSTYNYDHHRPCQRTTSREIAPKVAMVDENRDELDDCRVKWLRQYTGSFTKLLVGDDGLPTEEPSTLVVAAASVHLITKSHFEDPETQNSQHKRTVSARLARHLLEKYGAVERIMAGDWNIHRCSNRVDEHDYSTDDTGCTQYEWWRHLTDDRTYEEAVYAARSTEDDRLHPQYRDGCVTLADDGTCEQARYRLQRIDFVWDLGGDVTDASHDLSCGQVDDETFPPNCGSEKNPHRYADHRLVWGMFDYGIAP